MDYSSYEAYLTINGNTRKERLINQAKKTEAKRVNEIVSCQDVLIDGEARKLTIVYSTETNHKKITALPNESLYAGSIVEWGDTVWIIKSVDAEVQIHKRGDMYQCNTYLKWQDEEGNIKDCFGYSLNIGQFNIGIDGNKTLAVGEFTATIDIPCNEDTIKLKRDKRFLIGLVAREEPEAFVLTGRNGVTGNSNPKELKEGIVNYKDKVITLTLCHSEKSDRDNVPLLIADYFEPNSQSSLVEYRITSEDEMILRVGGGWNEFTLIDANNNIVTPTIWSVTTLPENENYIQYEITDNKIKIKALENRKIINTQILLEATNGSVNTSAFIRLVSLLG